MGLTQPRFVQQKQSGEKRYVGHLRGVMMDDTVSGVKTQAKCPGEGLWKGETL